MVWVQEGERASIGNFSDFPDGSDVGVRGSRPLRLVAPAILLGAHSVQLPFLWILFNIFLNFNSGSRDGINRNNEILIVLIDIVFGNGLDKGPGLFLEGNCLLVISKSNEIPLLIRQMQQTSLIFLMLTRSLFLFHLLRRVLLDKKLTTIIIFDSETSILI